MSDPIPAAARIVEHGHDTRAAIGRLRRLWPWLGEARIPGRPAAHLLLERRLSADGERIENEQVRRDRRAAALAVLHGRAPLAATPAPVRLGPVRARARVAATIRAAGGRIGARLPVALRDPSLHRPMRLCRWCAGSGMAARPADWPAAAAWPTGVTCGLCGGYGEVCAICETAGGCHCDLADVVVDACLDAIAARVTAAAAAALAGNIADDEVNAEGAVHMLNGAANLACNILGLREVDMRVIKAPCPACDRRELWADVASPNPDEWSVVCRSPLCVCGGAGCGCGRPVRWAGRRHRWPAAEFHALAERLGVYPLIAR